MSAGFQGEVEERIWKCCPGHDHATLVHDAARQTTDDIIIQTIEMLNTSVYGICARKITSHAYTQADITNA